MNGILPRVIIEMLIIAQDVFIKNKVHYFIVGAIARDLHLSKITGNVSPRRTNDVDFAVMVPDELKYDKIKAALIATGKFTADANNAIKLWYQQGIEIDLMPFGAIENEDREIRLQHPKLFTMDVPGFQEAAASLENVQMGKENFRACTVEGLILLKLYAWNDRPARTKDLQDIDLLLLNYVDITDKLYDDHFDVLAKYDETRQSYLISVSGHVVGRKLASLLGHEKEKIIKLKTIIDKRPVTGWIEMAIGLGEINEL